MKKVLLFAVMLVFAGWQLPAASKGEVKIVELTTATFKQKVWDFDKNPTFKRVGNVPIILDFYATWCRPCKMLAPHLHDIQKNYKGKLIVYKIDVDKEPELARRFNIEAMPTIVFIGSKTSYTSEVGYRDYNEFDVLVKKKFKL